jgi:ribosomal protein L4|tara:strand:+ start:394 stop:1170 length:777 start_codon:yes stop_codon:yes gene_type:complete
MKATLYDVKGKKKSEVSLPKIFDVKIREDVVSKYNEIDKFAQPHASDFMGGKKHSASGTISHKRHDWKGHYGKGIARLPRKTMWRRGTQFFWIGAEVSGTRGGRRAHPPKGIGSERKMNKKEIILAMKSAFASTADKTYVEKRYASVDKLDIKVPVVLESKLDNIKSKELISSLDKIYGDIASLILRKKSVRKGKGKLRGRKYKCNAGLLLIKGNEEKIKSKVIDVKSFDEVSISDLYPLGRLTAYTEKALEEIGGQK